MNTEPSSSAWRQLSLYESTDLVREFLKQRHGYEPKNPLASATEVACHIAQGRDYFVSARQAPELIRPLLLYYGVLALSRALILFLDKRREASLAPSHGVQLSRWTDTFASSPGLLGLSSLVVNIEKSGTFVELLRSTDNKETSTIYSEPYSVSRKIVSGGSPERLSNGAMELNDILSRIPDIVNLYESAYARPARTFRCTIGYTPTAGGGAMVTLSIHSLTNPSRDIETVQRLFTSALEALGYAESITRVQEVAIHFSKLHRGNEPANWPLIMNDRLGEAYVTAPMSNGAELSSLGTLYLLAYITGMLARYFPSRWAAANTLTMGDRIFPVVKAALASLEERYPHLILNELEVRPTP